MMSTSDADSGSIFSDLSSPPTRKRGMASDFTCRSEAFTAAIVRKNVLMPGPLPAGAAGAEVSSEGSGVVSDMLFTCHCKTTRCLPPGLSIQQSSPRDKFRLGVPEKGGTVTVLNDDPVESLQAQH